MPPIALLTCILGMAPVPEHVLLQTNYGDMIVKLTPEHAPRTSAQFAMLADAGVYDGTRFVRLEKGFVLQLAVAQDRKVPLTREQEGLIHPQALERSAQKHVRGILSLAHGDNVDSGETSFSIMLGGAPHLDGKYTTFGFLEQGKDVIEAIEALPVSVSTPVRPVLLEKARSLTREQMTTIALRPARLPNVRGDHVAANEPRVLLRTSMGDLIVRLFPDAAPKTVEQFLRLVEADAYSGTRFVRLEKEFFVQLGSVHERDVPLSEQQAKWVQRLPLEPSDKPHLRGSLSLARAANDPNSGETSFLIMLRDSPHLNGNYTVFGSVERGEHVLKAMEEMPPDKGLQSNPLSLESAVVVTRDQAKAAKLRSPSPPAAGSLSMFHTATLLLLVTLGVSAFALRQRVLPKTVASFALLMGFVAFVDLWVSIAATAKGSPWVSGVALLALIASFRVMNQFERPD